jgi:carbonic anhydrase
MQALLSAEPGGAQTPLKRWLRHGLPSLARLRDAPESPSGAPESPPEDTESWPLLAGHPPADAAERLCLANVVQQLEHLRAHDAVARALSAGDLELQGMYFHVGEAQAYLLSGDPVSAADGVFELVLETDLTA